MDQTTPDNDNTRPTPAGAKSTDTSGSGRQERAGVAAGVNTDVASGWSAPAGHAPSGSDPWATPPADTREIPRPTGTQTIPAAGDDSTANDAQPYGGMEMPPGPGAGSTTTGKSRRGTAMLVAVALGAGVLGGGAGAGIVSALDKDNQTSVVSSLGGNTSHDNSADNASALSNVEAVANKVLPSVVSISIVSQLGAATGSGVIISSDGEILTNNHVAEAGQSGDMTVTFSDGSTAKAQVLGLDPDTDLAVIKAQGVSGLTPATLGSSADLKVGEQVVAIGSPLGLEGTVTTGIVSALNRPVTTGQSGPTSQPTRFSAIQTDAPINPGNSGGPLVNMSGQVVGINTAIATSGNSEGSIGLGFAIPIDQASPIAKQLLESGKAEHAQIGIGVEDATGDVRGAEVRQINSGSAGAEAGLQEGDVITRVNDELVVDATSLIAQVHSYQPGDKISLTVVRDGQTQTIEVTLGSDTSSSS